MVQQIPKYLASFGRRKGRKLTPARKELMQEWGRVFIDPNIPHPNLLPEGEGMHGASSPSPAGRGQGEGLWLEIGFGSGEHLAEQALQNPKIQFIGCETFLDGCGALVRKIVTEKIENIRIWNDDARLLLAKLPENSVTRAFILFPDPWPKKRHNKRRLIGQETLDMLAHVMESGAELRVATDHPDYAEWIVVQVANNPNFHWLANTKKDWETAPTDHFTTRYQQKSLAGDMAYFLEFEVLATP